MRTRQTAQAPDSAATDLSRFMSQMYIQGFLDRGVYRSAEATLGLASNEGLGRILGWVEVNY